MKKIYCILSLLFISFCMISCVEKSDIDKTAKEVISKIPDSVSENITLPLEYNGYILTWTTDNDAITNTGVVTRDIVDIVVKISVEVKNDVEKTVLTKKVLVLKLDKEDYISIKQIASSEYGQYETKGVVKAVNLTSFIIEDNTASILVYKGSGWTCDVNVGDVLVINGTTTSYGKATQFSNDTTYEKVGTETNITYPQIKVGTNSLYQSLYESNKIEPQYVELKGIVMISGSYVNLDLGSSVVIGSISNPVEFNEFNALNGTEIYVKGYVTGISGGVYLNICMTSYKTSSDEDQSSIKSVLSKPYGKYTVSGTIVSVSDDGFILEEDGYLIFVESNKDLNKGQFVEVNGTTTEYYNSIRFINTKVTVKGTKTVLPKTSIELTLNILAQLTYDLMMPTYFSYEGKIEFDGENYYVTCGGFIIYIDSKYSSYVNSNVEMEFYLNFVNPNFNYAIIEKITPKDTDQTLDLHILTVNDLHGYILQDDYGKNGLSNLSYIIDGIREEDSRDDCVLIANGDMFQGTALSNLTHGNAVIEAMNKMKFDAMIIGNHEFDWGLEEIIKYFDGNEENGEANFPLLNANIYTKDNKLVQIDNGNIFTNTVVEKSGVKVGIIGYIGDVYSSINYSIAKEYYFDTDIASSVNKIASNMKKNGCDVIVVSIHGGQSGDIEYYDVNQSLYSLKYNNKYLVDAVVNGHTHSRQTGYINRSGVSLPLVQAGANCSSVGDITLSIDLSTKEVVKSNVVLHDVYEVDKKYNQNVQDVIDNLWNQYKTEITTPYSVCGETVNSRSDLYDWIANVMATYFKADVSICNTGGIRSTGDLYAGANVTLENMYMINPFDNYVMLVTVKGSDLKQFLSKSSIFTNNYQSINNNTEYEVAVIDYVYYWDDFPAYSHSVNTNVILRDLLIEDIKARKVFKPITESNAVISPIEKTYKVNYVYICKKEELFLI